MFLKSTWLHSAITLQRCNDRHLSVPHSSKFNECVDDTKLPTLATLKTDGHYWNGFLWRLEQKSIWSLVSFLLALAVMLFWLKVASSGFVGHFMHSTVAALIM